MHAKIFGGRMSATWLSHVHNSHTQEQTERIAWFLNPQNNRVSCL